MISRRLRFWAIAAGSLLASPSVAQVDEGLIVQPVIPQGFNRGRNVSVFEEPRPSYDANGIRIGSMRLYPRIETGAGVTTNTYLTSQNPTTSPYIYTYGLVRLISGWSRHSLQITGSTTQREYIGESQRNESLWSIDAAGRLDVYSSFTINADLNASRNVENLFTGEVSPTVAALSHYRRNFASAQATYEAGRIRMFALIDSADLNFSNVPLRTGGVVNQSDRNRHISRLTGQFEYARTPSISLFAQVSGERTAYDHDLLSGLPNLDSKAVRFLVGVNIDIASRIRGTIGMGYSIRNYDADLYKSVHGLSVESKIEFFPTDRLTIGLSNERTLEDSSIGSRSPYWNLHFQLRTDYELLRNLILSAAGDYSRQTYIDNSYSSNTYRALVAARYLASRRINLKASVNYSQRMSNNPAVVGSLNETRVEAGIAYQL